MVCEIHWSARFNEPRTRKPLPQPQPIIFPEIAVQVDTRTRPDPMPAPANPDWFRRKPTTGRDGVKRAQPFRE